MLIIIFCSHIMTALAYQADPTTCQKVSPLRTRKVRLANRAASMSCRDP